MSAFAFAAVSTEKLKFLFEMLCIAQCHALDRNEITEYNKRYDEIKAIEKELKSRVGDQRRVLLEFFVHENMQVRLTAARATLAIDPVAARLQLEAIRDSRWQPQAGDAGMALYAIDDGIYKPT